MNSNNSTEKTRKLKIGVLALQGAFIEHIQVLRELGATASEVRLPEDLVGLDGLIIPGGESTAIGKLMVNWGLLEPIKQMASNGTPIWGTCAGMILLAKDIGGLSQPLIGLMDIRVKRNAFGSQLDSFETEINVPTLGPLPFQAVFIRAPAIEEVGAGAQELARLNPEKPDAPPIIVAARERNLLATAFHPELTNDQRFHQLFIDMIGENK
jgi:5'-phosphate synthase pdxT subunit